MKMPEYRDVLTAARAGKAGALQEVRTISGRNNFADALRVKTGSRGMVSKSKPWIGLANEFGLRH